MSKLNMKEWINEIIQKKEVVAMPIMTHPGIEMIGKKDFLSVFLF